MTKGPWNMSAVLLSVAGLLVSGIGVYFLAFRPALLPEDIRFIGFSPTEVEQLGPRLGPWLSNVFHVLGGFALATGVVTIALAATSYRARSPAAVLAASLGGTVSIVLMAIVNFSINSDFKWLLAGFALVWASSLVAFAFEVPISLAQETNPSIHRGKWK
ncbi:hypothetical protein [Devosia sp.]|uniref:hypothetical protein n=1 Tax=Devosia sp. TaxID=1871048 RepID=UPI001A002699|nr:hypothetical protein [Devosia sp.]MBE0577900.1 hypothetical protein [Devosia sp.]